MATYEPIMQGIRSWLNVSTGVDKAKILAVDTPFVRPELPYFTVSLPQLDETVGLDEAVQGLTSSDAPIETAQGFRLGVVTVNGYGPSSADLLMQASLYLRRASVITRMHAAGFSLRPIAPMVDVSALLNDRIEKRFAKDFQLQYLLRDLDPEALIELTNISVGLTLERYVAHIDALIDTLTITC